ncbi:MAG: hypothetical protein OJF49_003501 [Ktedonobacterales bacterium]|jgi:hypothetical protein|nr:MAG: hypothetical protein OJF49_003501 [Ktedonobacterales bacterium]
MHGLVFVTWEKYLAERFGTSLLADYRQRIGESASDAPLASRVYEDERLLAGVAVASRLTRADVDTLLLEYGRYFILNGLTSRLCMYLLNQVHGGRDLLLMMSQAHEQMSQASEGIRPPLFGYGETTGDPTGMYLYYDSPRKLCSLLHGAIEGAGIRYGERVLVSEQTCMKRGDAVCTFAIRFVHPSTPLVSSPHPGAPTTARMSQGPMPSQPAPEQEGRWEAQHWLADQVYAVLPEAGGLTLSEVQEMLRARFPDAVEAARPFLVLEALNHLHHAGWVVTSANEPGDALGNRRYWRAQRVGS